MKAKAIFSPKVFLPRAVDGARASNQSDVRGFSYHFPLLQKEGLLELGDNK